MNDNFAKDCHDCTMWPYDTKRTLFTVGGGGGGGGGGVGGGTITSYSYCTHFYTWIQ